jgi:transcriptional regulator with XRE-family HTH domain
VAKTPATAFFGAELRRAREAAGLSREEFGKLVNYAPGTIGAFETGERFPQPALVEGADEHLNTGGLLGRMYETLLTSYVYPESFRPWLDIEREAMALRWYELAYLPGLLQTEQYARALLQSGRDDVESKVAARMERQEILKREHPPELVAVIDEGILRRPVGGKDVMRDQLRSLADAADRWIVQVVPWEVDNYLCLDGPFVLATVDGSDLVYTPTHLSGYVLNGTEAVAEVRWRWDAIRAEALSRRQSRDLILEVARTYE